MQAMRKALRGSVPVLMVAAVLVAASGCSRAGSAGTRQGDVAPDFSLPALDGGARNLRDYRGQAVVLNFWASWCGPCRAEMPDMQVVYSELRDSGFVVLGVNQDESRDVVEGFATEFGLTFPILLDEDHGVARKYGVRAYPTTFIIDGKGVIREVIVGGPLTRSAIRQQVKDLLK